MIKELKIEKVITKSNEITAKVNGYFLHSRYDPKKEAIQFVEKNYKPNSLHILFGYGLGYFANALIEKLGVDDDILVIDPYYDLLNEGIEPKVKVVKNIEEVNFNKILNNKIEEFNRRVHIIQSPNYDKINNDIYKQLLEIVNEKLKLDRINENTIRFFAEDWQKNYLFNLYNAVGDKSLVELKEKYDLPIVIASGGPSLTKQLSLLYQIKDKVLIIAAGSTINTLLSSNIIPDFVVSVDGSIANYNHFENINSIHTTYIYSLTSHYGIRKSFEKPAYIFNSYGKDKMKNHFENLTKLDIPLIAGGGSVANFAFTIAAYITSGPIAIIGQDLAYTDNKTHAENNKNFKKVDDEYKKTRGMFFTEGYYTEEVLTDYVFLSMKESFENIMNLIGGGREIYNCTEGGINLKGFKKLPFKDFCRNNIQSSVVKKNTLYKNKKIDRRTLLKKMKKELDLYNEIRKILNENLKVLNANNPNNSFLSSTLKKLDRNDEKLKRYIEEVSMVSILDPITLNIQNNFLPVPNESAKETYKRAYNQNKELYSRLIDALDFTVKYTEELISKIVRNEDEQNGKSDFRDNVEL